MPLSDRGDYGRAGSVSEINQKYFYSRFHRGATQKGIVWLGGGCGYPSKTILYPMFEQDAVRVIDRIYKNTISAYDKHKHGKDVALNIAPHVCKCTRYQGRLYDMGMGQIVEYEGGLILRRRLVKSVDLCRCKSS